MPLLETPCIPMSRTPDPEGSVAVGILEGNDVSAESVDSALANCEALVSMYMDGSYYESVNVGTVAENTMPLTIQLVPSQNRWIRVPAPGVTMFMKSFEEPFGKTPAWTSSA